MVIRAVRTLRAACGGGRPQGLPVRQKVPPSPFLSPLRRGRFLAWNESEGRRDGRGQCALPRRSGSRGAQAGPLRRPHSQRRPLYPVAEFVAAKGPALVPVADRIGRKFRLRRKRGGAVFLGAALRPIAEAERRAVVPPATHVVGDAIKYFVANVGMLEADADELYKVLRRDPDRESAPVDRHIAEVADADASNAQSVLVCIKRAERLAERLADAVAGIRTHRGVNSDAPLARIKADRMVRRGEYHPLDAVATRRLEQMVATDDVGLQDRVP